MVDYRCMTKTSWSRASLAAAIAFVCAEAYLVGGSHGSCADFFGMLISAIEVQIIVGSIGIFIVTLVGSTAFLAWAESLDWRIVTIGALGGTVVLTMLLYSLQTTSGTKAWIVAPVLGSIALCALTTFAVRKLSTRTTATLGAIAAILCFALAYVSTPYTGSGACGFAP